jgi:hypothetical protein
VSHGACPSGTRPADAPRLGYVCAGLVAGFLGEARQWPGDLAVFFQFRFPNHIGWNTLALAAFGTPVAQSVA